MEALVRLANAKYRETGQVQTYAEATELLIKDCLIEQYDWRPWQEFRDEQLYTLAVNDVLFTNMAGIEKLAKLFLAPRKHQLKMNDCLLLFTRHTESGLTEKDFYYCYGMSKMTVAKETLQHKQYENVQMAEFLELICRAADCRYAESVGTPLA